MRAAGGRGRVAPYHGETIREAEPPHGKETPDNPEGEGLAGHWSEDGDLERLQREEFD